MNTPSGEKSFPRTLHRVLTRALIVAGFLFLATAGRAQLGFPTGSGPTNTPLDSWSFGDSTYWTSDNGYAPVSFTNLNFAQLGNGQALVVDTNVPAWLQYNVYENDGTTNLTVDQGSVTFWFAPDWSSTNQGGAGPGESARLLETGGYTPDSSYGWWSIYTESGGNYLYFSAQTNDLSSNLTSYVCVPISWATNSFHFVALTYCATNTALYLDGVLATNGPGVTVYPGLNALTNGFFIGSDSPGVSQAHGFFNAVANYNYPLGSNDVQAIYNWELPIYEIAPWSKSANNIASASSQPTYTPTYDAIAGQGSLQNLGSAATCSYGTNAYNVWITNVVAKLVGTGTNKTMNLTFAIEGGADNAPYDVFANSVLSFGTNGTPWAWMGQGNHCNIYTITNLPNSTCFVILGTPLDSDGDGLTDAYELLVSKTNPYNPDTSGDGLSDSDKILLGLNPLAVNPSIPASPSVQTCPQ
jgi:hypothetical protein